MVPGCLGTGSCPLMLGVSQAGGQGSVRRLREAGPGLFLLGWACFCHLLPDQDALSPALLSAGDVSGSQGKDPVSQSCGFFLCVVLKYLPGGEGLWKSCVCVCVCVCVPLSSIQKREELPSFIALQETCFLGCCLGNNVDIPNVCLVRSHEKSKQLFFQNLSS